jgi:hypothetical protein
MTLAHIVAELLARGSCILITSTTNAAVDQVLAKLAESHATQSWLAQGKIVRVGEPQGETYGAALGEVTARLHADVSRRLMEAEACCTRLDFHIRCCGLLLEKLGAEAAPQQLGLFATAHATAGVDLSPVFSIKLGNAMRRLDVPQQLAAVEQRRRRLEFLLERYREQIRECRATFAHQEQYIVQMARVVLTTTTQLYVTPLLQDARFDVVIVEEAGMTILPALFYCASLAREKLVIVGDPRQLPVIVQSDDAFVQKYLGMSIFDVAIPDLHTSDVVAMLDVQYRMHPVIGQLVSRLYYDRKLRDDDTTSTRSSLAALAPYEGEPLIVVDTAGQTVSATHPGQRSRFNRATARLCVELAAEGVRNGIASVGIITPYAEQARLIRELRAAYPAEESQIESRTVHRFQGSERDMIILDTVDTAPFPPGVLLTGTGPKAGARNLVNVSISRARGKLIIVADVAYFRTHAPNSAVTLMLDQAIVIGRSHVYEQRTTP